MTDDVRAAEAARLAAPVVVQLSGGYDSAAVLLHETQRLAATGPIHAVFVDYGQPYRAAEEAAARRYWVSRGGGALSAARLARWHRLRVELPCAHHIPGMPVEYIPARNWVLATVMAHVAESVGARRILVGNKGVEAGGSAYAFPDAGAAFFSALSATSALISAWGPERAPQFEQPLLGWSKAAVMTVLHRAGIDLRRLWNCYAPAASGEHEEVRPCGTCFHCVEMRRVLDQSIGRGAYEDWWPYTATAEGQDARA
jgi:7-cyano-7-deazaguanine synthase